MPKIIRNVASAMQYWGMTLNIFIHVQYLAITLLKIDIK